jgi:hypothetical protein
MPLLAKTAWIIYWQVMGASVAITVKENEIVTALSSRLGIEKATATLEQLYRLHSYTLEEQIKWRQPGSGPYKVENNLRFHGVPATGRSYSIGHNPMLTLRKVEQLKQTGTTISWVEESVAHPAWLCKEIGHPDCKLAGLPAQQWVMTYELPNEGTIEDNEYK